MVPLFLGVLVAVVFVVVCGNLGNFINLMILAKSFKEII